MKSTTLPIDTGEISLAITTTDGKPMGNLRFSPTDLNMTDRLAEVAEYLKALTLPDDAPADAIAAVSAAITEKLDYLLGGNSGIEAVFAECSPLTITKKGTFFFEELVNGIAKVIESETKSRINAKINSIRRNAAARR